MDRVSFFDLRQLGPFWLVQVSMKRVVTALLVLLLGTATASKEPEWFLPTRHSLQTGMLKELFKHPVTDWPQILGTNRDLLDPSFFKKVEQRIQWGIETGHCDDANRFKAVFDSARIAIGRRARYSLSEGPDPKASRVIRVDRAYSYHDFIYISLQEWANLINTVPPDTLDDKFFHRLDYEIDQCLLLRDRFGAMTLAFIGDLAFARLGEESDYRFRTLRRLPEGTKISIPMDPDLNAVELPFRRQHIIENVEVLHN